MVESQRKGTRKCGGIITINSKQRLSESVQTVGRIMKQKSADETIRACFNCGEKGHLIFNCSKGAWTPYNNHGQNQRQLPAPPQRTQGRVFALTNKEASNAHDVVKGSGKAPM